VGDAKALGNIVSGMVVTSHGRCRGPSEVVVKHPPKRHVFDESDVSHGLIEAGNRSAVHLLVPSVAAVHAHDRRLVAKGGGVGGRAAECLGLICSKSLAVSGVETMAERVADYRVIHNPAMPRIGQAT